MTKSNLEAAFDTLLKQLHPNMPEPEREYRFLPDRKWRFDRAWPDVALAVEIEGGTWMMGRHSREPGYSKDCEKYNMAAMHGWRVFRLTAKMLKEDPYTYLLHIYITWKALKEGR